MGALPLAQGEGPHSFSNWWHTPRCTTGSLHEFRWALSPLGLLFKVLIHFLFAALSGGSLLQSVMSQQYNCLMKLYTNFTKFYFSQYLPSTFILRCMLLLGLRWLCMHVHDWTLLTGLLIYPRKIKEILWKSMYKVNRELFTCGITDFGRGPSREGDIQNFG